MAESGCPSRYWNRGVISKYVRCHGNSGVNSQAWSDRHKEHLHGNTGANSGPRVKGSVGLSQYRLREMMPEEPVGSCCHLVPGKSLGKEKDQHQIVRCQVSTVCAEQGLKWK